MDPLSWLDDIDALAPMLVPGSLEDTLCVTVLVPSEADTVTEELNDPPSDDVDELKLRLEDTDAVANVADAYPENAVIHAMDIKTSKDKVQDALPRPTMGPNDNREQSILVPCRRWCHVSRVTGS